MDFGKAKKNNFGRRSKIEKKNLVFFNKNPYLTTATSINSTRDMYKFPSFDSFGLCGDNSRRLEERGWWSGRQSTQRMPSLPATAAATAATAAATATAKILPAALLLPPRTFGIHLNREDWEIAEEDRIRQTIENCMHLLQQGHTATVETLLLLALPQAKELFGDFSPEVDTINNSLFQVFHNQAKQVEADQLLNELLEKDSLAIFYQPALLASAQAFMSVLEQQSHTIKTINIKNIIRLKIFIANASVLTGERTQREVITAIKNMISIHLMPNPFSRVLSTREKPLPSWRRFSKNKKNMQSLH